MVYNLHVNAGVVELADARDSKSRVREDVRVRPPPPAPRRKDPLPLRFPLSRQTAQDGVLSPFSAATRCAGFAAGEDTVSNTDCSGEPKGPDPDRGPGLQLVKELNSSSSKGFAGGARRGGGAPPRIG